MADTERGLQWWVRYVAVPVLTSGTGILAITLVLKYAHAEPAPAPATPPAAQAVGARHAAPPAVKAGDDGTAAPKAERPARPAKSADGGGESRPKPADGEAETSVQDDYASGVFFQAKRHASCDARGNVTGSPGPNLPVNIRNNSGRRLKIYWIGGDGVEHPGDDLTEKPSAFGSGSNLPFLVTDESGQCLRIFRATQKYSHFTFTAPSR